MRSYGQYCALARTLDVVGDRWTLLIIRELFAGDARYSDLREALPGIATNLLAQRLRQLQEDGIIESYEAPRPVRATVYRLTPRGRELGPVLKALVRWGGPLVREERGEDEFRSRWLALALPIYFEGVDVSDVAPLTVRVDTGDDTTTLTVTAAGVETQGGEPATTADVEVSGDPEPVVTFLTGGSDGKDLEMAGARESVRRLRRLASRSSLAAQRA